MVLHALPDYTGYLVEVVILLLKKRVKDPPLHRFQAVFKIGNGPVFDNVGRVFKKIPVKNIFYVCHYLNV